MRSVITMVMCNYRSNCVAMVTLCFTIWFWRYYFTVRAFSEEHYEVRFSECTPEITHNAIWLLKSAKHSRLTKLRCSSENGLTVNLGLRNKYL